MDGAKDDDDDVEAAMCSSAATSLTLYAQGDQSGAELHFHERRPRRGGWRGGCHLHTCGAKHGDDDVRAGAAGVQPGVTSTSTADDAKDDDNDNGMTTASVKPDALTAPAVDGTQDDDGDTKVVSVQSSSGGAPVVPDAMTRSPEDGVAGLQPSAISITALGAKPAAISGMDGPGDWVHAPP
jgi:hypothetical protein